MRLGWEVGTSSRVPPLVRRQPAPSLGVPHRAPIRTKTSNVSCVGTNPVASTTGNSRVKVSHYYSVYRTCSGQFALHSRFANTKNRELYICPGILRALRSFQTRHISCSCTHFTVNRISVVKSSCRIHRRSVSFLEVLFSSRGTF